MRMYPNVDTRYAYTIRYDTGVLFPVIELRASRGRFDAYVRFADNQTR